LGIGQFNLDGLFLFEFSQGVRWEFGVVSVLWGRLKGLVEIRHTHSFLGSYLRCGGLAELQKRIVVSASGSALWAGPEVLAKKQQRIMQFCTGICVMGQFQGFIRKTDTHLPHRYLCCGVVAGGCAELHRRTVVSA